MIAWDFVARRLHYSDEHAMWMDLYVEKRLTLVEMGDRFGVSHSTVRDALRRCKIPMRTAGGANRTPDPRWPPAEAFLKEVDEFGTLVVAERLGFSPSAVYKRARRLRRAQAPANGDSESSTENERQPGETTEYETPKSKRP